MRRLEALTGEAARRWMEEKSQVTSHKSQVEEEKKREKMLTHEKLKMLKKISIP